MIETIKIFLWKMGLRKACPLCNSKIKKVHRDYNIGDAWSYICTNDECEMGEKNEV